MALGASFQGNGQANSYYKPTLWRAVIFNRALIWQARRKECHFDRGALYFIDHYKFRNVHDIMAVL